MNNWHLLLLAIVAVFQPIASFSERNLVDGREQCCGRETDTLLRESRSFIYGADRFTKATTPELRLNERDETRADRRSVLRQRDTFFSRRYTERSLLDTQRRDSRRIPSNLVRSSRVEYRSERFSADVNRERRVDNQQRQRYARNTRDNIKSEEQSRRVLSRETRDSVMLNDDSTYPITPRNSLSRKNFRVTRSSNKRLAEVSRRVSRSSNERLAEESRRVSRSSIERLATESRRVSRSSIERLAAESRQVSRSSNERHAEESRRVSRSSNVRLAEDSIRVSRVSNERLAEDSRQVSRLSNERLAEDSDSQQERMQTRSEDFRRIEPTRDARDGLRRLTPTRDQKDSLRRLTPTRDAQDDLRQTQKDVIRLPFNGNERRNIVRQQVNIVHREISSRVEEQRYLDNNNKNQEREHHAQQRRALSENSRVAERIRDTRIRENSRNERRENRDLSANQRFTIERPEERRQQPGVLRQSREQIRKNNDRRLSRERMQIDRRDIRESRINNDMKIRLEQDAENRRDVRYNERQASANRDNRVISERPVTRDSRRIFPVERDNRMTERRARSQDLRNFRDTKVDARMIKTAEVVRGRDASRKHVEYRNKMETPERDAIDTRFGHVNTRNDMMTNKVEMNDTVTNNWEYILYTLQGAYLCGLFMEMMLPNRSEKSKMQLRWWPMSSQSHIKVD